MAKTPDYTLRGNDIHDSGPRANDYHGTASWSEVEAKFNHSEVDTNKHGAKQSKLDFRFDLVDPESMQRLAHVLWYGSTRYGVGNWKNIPIGDNLNHALYHIYQFLAGSSREDHLGHAFARIMFAMYIERNGTLVEQEQRTRDEQSGIMPEPTFTIDTIAAILRAQGLSTATRDLVVSELQKYVDGL